MTNCIEEMMETADVCGDSICSNCDRNAPGDTLGLFCNGCMSIDEMIYPDFTAEKQLEIIKLIGKFKDFNCFFDNRSRRWFFSAGLELPVCFDFQEENTDFTQALAQLTTELMNAGKLDKEKVKEILEG